MLNLLKKSFYKNGYLLIIAAWLYTISFIFSNYKSYLVSPSRVKSQFESFIKKGEANLDKIARDTAFITAVISPGKTLQQLPAYIDPTYCYFIYAPEGYGELHLKFWSNNKVVPEERDIARPDGKSFAAYRNGEFEIVKKTVSVAGKQIIAIGIIPIQYHYFINNKYLVPTFPAAEGIEQEYELARSHADFYIKNGDNKVLFGLKDKKQQASSPGFWSLLFRISAIIFFLAFLNVLAYDLAARRNWITGFGFLVLSLLLLRFLTYQFPFPFNYRTLDLFDPTIYASSTLHKSLGDLVINVILVFWVVSFIKFSAFEQLRRLKPVANNKAWFGAVILSVCLISIAFIAAELIRGLIVDSQISFDVSVYSSLNKYSFLSFIVLCFIILTFFHLSHVILLLLDKCAGVPGVVRYLVVAVAGLIYLTLHVSNATSANNVIVLLWLLSYMFMMEFRREDLFVPILKSSFFLIWLIFFAGSISALIIFQNHYKNIERGVQKAKQLAENADPNVMPFMNEGVAQIKDEFLSANFYRFNSETSNKQLKDSIINEYFSLILNKYDTKIYTFDQYQRPLYNEDFATYRTISNNLVRGTRATENDITHYVNDVNTVVFVYSKEVRDSTGEKLGSFFVIAEAKKYKYQSLYPELYTQEKDAESNVERTYAVYNKGKLINSTGDYDFLTEVPRERFLKQEFREEVKKGFTEFWYKTGYNTFVIIVRQGSLFIESVTLFAYLFGSFLFIVILFRIGHFLIRNKFRITRIRFGLMLNIKKQIQGSIIFISIFSFVIIGVTTIYFYRSRFENNKREGLVHAIKELSEEIESEVAGHSMQDDAIRIDDLGTGTILESKIKRIAEIHNVEANFFNLEGRLTASSVPYTFEKKVLSPYMEPLAFYNLKYNNKIHYIQDEQIGKLSFLSIYKPIHDPNGETYAYVNIPSLNTQKELNQEISTFLVTLINLNAFIFVIAGAISVLLTNRITNSFSLLAEKMKQVKLGKTNEEIVYNSDDEIGTLVNEYNKMVKKLEESASALAKSEREGAWREMARQVAHEIKNPLTPMKLSIQYLQKAIQENNPNVVEMSKKVSTTLVEQIDQLAKIASDFSQFANISKTTTEDFNVNHVIDSLVNLYSSDHHLNITYNHTNQPAIIHADRSQISRLFTNLFKNAVEASDGKDIVNVTITQEINENKLHVSFQDEGSGIPEEKRDKIFTPNFTTKSSGTGLGLAISKGIVENANGRIWFETEEGRGTTFHILLPLVGLPE